MTTLFITAGGIEWASSRMRAYWPAQYMDATVMTFDEWRAHPERMELHDAFIFQKRIDANIARNLRDAGFPVWVDFCDPVWWWQPDEARQVAQSVTGVVCSSEALLQDFLDWMKQDGPPLARELQAHVIPDRMELLHFTRQREHDDVTPVRLIWFGIAANRVALYGALPYLERLAANGHRTELTLFDDRPDVSFSVTRSFPIYYTPWKLDRENDVLASHDIALLPPYPMAWGKVKSNNRSITAALCGLAVTQAEDYWQLERLVESAAARQQQATEANEYARRHYDVRLSAQEWQELLGC